MATQDCGWKSESCGALALRWNCCSMIKPSCLPRSMRHGVVPGAKREPDGASAPATATRDVPAGQRTD